MLLDKVRVALLLSFAVLFSILSAGVYGSLYQQSYVSQLGLSSYNEIPTGDISISFGSSISPSCTSYPCASGYFTGSGEFEFNFGLFPLAVSNPQPQVFYADVLDLEALSQPVNVSSLAVSDVKISSPLDLGAITIYFCGNQTNDPIDNCRIQLTVNTTSDGVVPVNETIMPRHTTTIEVSGFADENATLGDMISFDLTIS